MCWVTWSLAAPSVRQTSCNREEDDPAGVAGLHPAGPHLGLHLQDSASVCLWEVLSSVRVRRTSEERRRWQEVLRETCYTQPLLGNVLSFSLSRKRRLSVHKNKLIELAFVFVELLVSHLLLPEPAIHSSLTWSTLWRSQARTSSSPPSASSPGCRCSSSELVGGPRTTSRPPSTTLRGGRGSTLRAGECWALLTSCPGRQMKRSSSKPPTKCSWTILSLSLQNTGCDSYLFPDNPRLSNWNDNYFQIKGGMFLPERADLPPLEIGSHSLGRENKFLDKVILWFR